ncbi:hypothetical protein Ancab_007210 [Ancistrocladus abbreviatus]
MRATDIIVDSVQANGGLQGARTGNHELIIRRLPIKRNSEAFEHVGVRGLQRPPASKNPVPQHPRFVSVKPILTIDGQTLSKNERNAGQHYKSRSLVMQ